jgi:two-component system, chemotaxis family, chemotaxis protein CheY
MPVNILIVDDSKPMRSVIVKTIKASGFENAVFLEASNGKGALDLLRKEWMDLVITDYNMPDMNGLELIQEMKKNEVLSTIPVLVVTTEGSHKRVAEFIEQGATDYVKKPFTPEIIKEKISNILGEMEYNDESLEDGSDEFDF